MEVRLARIEDIQSIVDLRLCYFKEVYTLFYNDEIMMLGEMNKSFLEKELNKTCFVSLAIIDNKVVSTAFMSFLSRSPNRGCTDGYYGEVYGVYTNKSFRRKGCAIKCMKLLIDTAKDFGIKRIRLDASKEGRSLYESLGFYENLTEYVPMSLDI